jgi:hypothetical protein
MVMKKLLSLEGYQKAVYLAAAMLFVTLSGAACYTQPAVAAQPHMQEALDALQDAERELLAATDDKGGHRVQALELVRKAMAQVKAGIRFDRRN